MELGDHRFEEIYAGTAPAKEVEHFLATAANDPQHPKAVLDAFYAVIEAIRSRYTETQSTHAQIVLIGLKEQLVDVKVDLHTIEVIHARQARLDVAIVGFVLSHGLKFGIKIEDVNELNQVSAFLINNLVEFIRERRALRPSNVALAGPDDVPPLLEYIAAILDHIREFQSGSERAAEKDPLSLGIDGLEPDNASRELTLEDLGDVEGVISEVGFERAVRIYANLIRERIANDRVRWQFLLEELEGASHGNAYARDFVRSIGVPESEYRGAIGRSFPEVDGPGGPQQLLRALCMQLISDQDLMVRFTIAIVTEIFHDHEMDRCEYF